MIILVVNIVFTSVDYKVTMAALLTSEQRKFVVKRYWKHENANTVREDWTQAYPGVNPPSRQTIYR